MTRAPLPLAQVALSSINHVLQQQSALRQRLQLHAGRCLRIVVDAPFPLRGSVHADARIGSDGLFELTTQSVPAAVLTLSPHIDALFGALRSGPSGLGPHLKVDGDVMLAAAIGEVLRSLSWDYEEDLSRVLGDGLAHRIGRAVRSAAAQARALGAQ